MLGYEVPTALAHLYPCTLSIRCHEARIDLLFKDGVIFVGCVHACVSVFFGLLFLLSTKI